jgi:hypothetical protein
VARRRDCSVCPCRFHAEHYEYDGTVSSGDLCSRCEKERRDGPPEPKTSSVI